MWWKTLVVWLLIAAAETLHGILRQWLLVPAVGDLRAHQIGVFIGSAIILIITRLTIRWIGAKSLYQCGVIGGVWVTLMISFEILLGLSLGMSRDRLWLDYDLTQGRILTLGLLVLGLAPSLVAKRIDSSGSWKTT